MTKKMAIRRNDTCAGCGVDLPAGTTAYWIAAERIVRCVTCQEAGDIVEAAEHQLDVASSDAPAATPAVMPPAVDPTDEEVQDQAGRSAQVEYDKRAARELAAKRARVAEDTEWRRSIKDRRPVVGRIAAGLTPKPQIGPEAQATTAWKIGAEGERRVAEVLAQVAGIEVLHDRRVPGSRANIDHLVVGPKGVFVIDAKKYTGEIEVRDVGGLFRLDERLYVNRRDRTKLVDGVLGQIEVVRGAMGEEFAHVEVQGVLCFIGCEWGWIMRKKRVKGVTALWPKALADHVAAPGHLDDEIEAVANHLRSRLRPAT
ncbi:MAG: NERD domain-containing protein [Acidimicrobiia bacterium]|nr:NERD domain-containing protein [Acidimicrobiia bacterium]